MDKKDLQAALKWQSDMGIDDTFTNTPTPKMAYIPEIAPQPRAEAPQAQAFREPATAQYQPRPAAMPQASTNPISEVPSMAKAAPKPEPRTNNVEFLNNSNLEWVKLAKEQADKAKTLEELKKAVEEFNGLSIRKSATNTVFGEGNPKSDIMFIGEAPGENEDLEGRPFCGLSGQLLDKMLKFIGLERAKNFYITNTLFWRPPGNRKPTPEELAICKPFVEKHIALINPKVIVLVGGTATFSVLGSKESISVMRKSISQYNNEYLGKSIPCFAVYHPSFLLRSPSQKKNAWADMIKIKKYLNGLQ